MTFRTSAPRKRSRWLVLFAAVAILTGLLATTALAVTPTFTWSPNNYDQQGANDEPGQKDLTAQASVTDGDGHFWTAWRWDDTSWSGKNSGDGCSLFTSDGDEFVDYAVCATIGGKTVQLSTVTVYSCSDNRVDRCTNPVLLSTTTSLTQFCNLSVATPGTFDTTAADTEIHCDISAISAALTTPLPALAGASLINTCSYPSREPNSDPSDCIFEALPVTPALTTTSDATMAWTATLDDEAFLSPNPATGSVTFKLYEGATCSDDAITGNLLATSTDTDGTDGWNATSYAASGTGSTTFLWTVTYNAGAGYTTATEVCDEQITITATAAGSNSTP